MKDLFANKTWIIALMILVLSVLACSLSTPDPTPEPIAEEPIAEPTEEIEFFLSVENLPVNVIGENGTVTELTEGEIVSIQAGDTISVGAKGLAKLQAGKRLTSEIFNGTELQVSNASTNINGSATIKLNQVHGQARFTIPEGARTTVIITTIFEKVTTVEDDTQFIICHDPTDAKLTCNDVQRGEVEIEAQGKVISVKAEEATFTLEGQAPKEPTVCEHTDELDGWLEQLRNGEDVPPLGALVARWFTEPCPGDAPTATAEGLVTPTFAPPYTPFVRIINITIDDQQRYVVEYETYGYTEQLPGVHVHFFFNTVYQENAGVPGSGPWILYGGPRPFTGYAVKDRPDAATQMCARVANSNHSIQLDSGNCVDLP